MSDDLADLIRDFGRVPRDIGPEVKKALGVTSRGMKEGWRNIAAASSGAHAKAYPFSVGYDVRSVASGWEAEVGPELGRAQGPLGILEDAPGGVAAAPQKARPRLVKSGEKDFERGMDRAAADALRRSKL